MKTYIELVIREFKLFWSNSVLRMLFIGAPLAYGILFGFVYQKGKVTDLPIVVVDEDNSPMSQRMIEMLGDNETIKIAAIVPANTDLHSLSIKYNAACVVMIPDRFEADILYKRYPEIPVYVNTDNILTANFASKAIQIVTGTLKAGVQMEALRKTGVPEELLMSQYEPFQVTYIKNYNTSGNYMYFLWPGMLATIFQQVLFLALALTFSAELESGTFNELVKKSRTSLMAIVAKCTPYFIMSFVIWICYALMHLYFKVPLGYNLGWLTLIAGLLVFSVSMIGILVSILIPNQLKATEILMVIATPSFVLSGFTWPLSQMPVWVQYLAQVIPLTHFLEAYRTATIQNGGFDALISPVTKMFVLGLVAGIIAWICIEVKFRKAKKGELQITR